MSAGTTHPATFSRVILTELSSTVSLRRSRVRIRPLMSRQTRRLSNDVAVRLKRPPLLLRWLKRRERRHRRAAEPAEAGREQLTPTPTRRRIQSTSRCQNSSSRTMKGQRDRLTCRGESGERSQRKRKGAAESRLDLSF